MTFTLQLLHASDLEGGVEAIQSAPNFAAVVDALETDASNQGIASILLSAGDNYIPGPFFGASSDRALRTPLDEAYATLLGVSPDTLDIREGVGRVDIAIMNIIGFDASVLGNHEFDAGTSVVREIFGPDIRDGNGDGVLDNVRNVGPQFPYLSSNLDFSGDSDLSRLFTDAILPNTDFQADLADLATTASAPKIAPATIIEVDGELIGIVGATTPLLESISSTGGVQVQDPGAGTNDMVALASILQPVIDDLIDGADNVLGTDDDLNKIVLVSHLQQIALEQTLVPLLSGVDISIAGGSDTLLADETDRLRTGDSAAADYPVVTTNADGEPAVIVSTDGEYSYVGRLVIEFDDNGVLIPDSIDSEVSGAYATDDQGVTDLETDLGLDLFTEGSKGSEVQALTEAVEDVVIAQDGNIFGLTSVFLEGNRSLVRTEETNLGNLSADANLFVARQIDPTVTVSIKNGGGIRAQIGEVVNDSDNPEETLFLPPQANELSGKEEGEVSQLDIANSLRFNNNLTLLTLTAAELELVVEHGVAATAPGATPGQFPQVGGISFSFDATQQAVDFGDDGSVVTEGERVQSLAIVDENGEILDVIVQGGELVGDPNREIRIVTLNFLADGGDSYPFPAFGDERVELTTELATAPEGAANFAPAGSEQDALAEFLAANFAGTPFDVAETPAEEDTRIQNLAVRNDEVLAGTESLIFGSPDGDSFEAGLTPGFDGISDILFTGAGDDFVALGNTASVVIGGSGVDELETGERDRLFGGEDGDILESSVGDGGNRLYGGDGPDELIAGVGDRLFGGPGDDTFFLNALGADGGDNRAYGQSGNDTFFLGTNDRVVGDAGDDVFFVTTEGGNTLTGGDGADTFSIINAELPTSENIITDFVSGTDIIGISFAGITAPTDLTITQDGSDTLIAVGSLTVARFLNTEATTLQDSANFSIV